ncbi:MAG: DUF4350 domain-containing protein [Halobacteriales archaeon]
MAASRDRLRRAGVLVATIVIVTVAASAAPYVGGGGAEPRQYEAFNVSQTSVEAVPAGGTPQVEASGESGLVVIDNSHQNRYSRENIEPLVSAITAAGYQVEFAGVATNLESALSRADAYIVIDPGRRFSELNAEKVSHFVADGGRLVMMGEPRQAVLAGFALRTVSNRMAPLSTQFGIEFGDGYVYNMQRNDGNYRNVLARATGSGTVTEGIDRTAFFTATQVQGGEPVLTGIEGTRSIRGDSPGTYRLAVRSGNVMAVGDTSFITRQNYNVADNEVLIGNIARFVTGGERSRDLSDYPYIIDNRAQIRYTDVELLDTAQDVAEDVRVEGGTAAVSLDRDTIPGNETDVLVTTFEDIAEQDISGPGGTGITVSGDRVAVQGYESSTDGVIVLRAPQRSDIDVVIAADTTEHAATGETELDDATFEQHLIDNRTAVIRTG